MPFFFVKEEQTEFQRFVCQNLPPWLQFFTVHTVCRISLKVYFIYVIRDLIHACSLPEYLHHRNDCTSYYFVIKSDVTLVACKYEHFTLQCISFALIGQDSFLASNQTFEMPPYLYIQMQRNSDFVRESRLTGQNHQVCVELYRAAAIDDIWKLTEPAISDDQQFYGVCY